MIEMISVVVVLLILEAIVNEWIDEYGYWFDPFYNNPNQLELF